MAAHSLIGTSLRGRTIKADVLTSAEALDDCRPGDTIVLDPAWGGRRAAGARGRSLDDSVAQVLAARRVPPPPGGCRHPLQADRNPHGGAHCTAHRYRRGEVDRQIGSALAAHAPLPAASRDPAIDSDLNWTPVGITEIAPAAIDESADLAGWARSSCRSRYRSSPPAAAPTGVSIEE